ncbi:MAG TPA: hypothetical protein VM734_31305 [Kofleriaceae bacterium]|nr:hypothetical protein [Kofleriaceae bacterium]
MTTAASPELAALAQQLQQDAARELLPTPSGAQSVRRATELGTTATPLLRDRIQARGADLLLALEALRLADPSAYAAVPAAERAAAYAAALAHSTYFNAWGQPGMQLSDTAHAFAGLGADAVPTLTPLLDDLRPAPAHGSQDATLSRMNGNRVCDFAWVLIQEARGQAYAYLTAPADRDREIAALKAALSGP